MTIERRWEPREDPEDVGEDAELASAIRDEIRDRGPITFARFMERGLYEPGHGYYRRTEAAPGRHGDFLTAPEAHPIFGAAVGRLLEQAWDALERPDPFTVIEQGAGTGALAEGLLTGLRRTGSPLAHAIRYRPVELEASRLPVLRDRLAAAGVDDALDDDADETVGTDAVVANEVLDALPVHRVVARDGRLREVLVTTADDGSFGWLEAEPTTPELQSRLDAEGIALADGEVTEICLELEPWLRNATRDLPRGVVVLVDYAAEPETLHGSAHPTGTLRAFARHAVSGDPLRHIGRQDLTATVDLAAVRAAAAAAGLVPVGETTQGELLASVGTATLTDAWLRAPGATLQDALALRSALARLMDPRAMGGFRVLVFGRGVPSGIDLPALHRLARPGA